MEHTNSFNNQEPVHQDDVKKIIDKLEIDYSTTDLQVAYQELRKKINLDNYFVFDRDNDQRLFYFALNVRVLPEGNFIPFIYINQADEKKKSEIRDWAAKTFYEGLIHYNFSDFLQDNVLDPINEMYPQSEFFFTTQFDEKYGRYLINEFQVVPKGVKSEKISISPNLITNLNNRLLELDNKDFIQQMSQLFYKQENDIPYFFPGSDGVFYFALYSFDSDYKTNAKLTNWLVLSDNKEEIENFVNHRIRKIRDLASLIRIRFTRDILRKQELESIKSAKAAIMSRNMSHNIGSHVMSYLKQHLGSVKDIVADGILSDLINGESELAKKLENTTENTTLPFLMGLGHFISYLQERQDFIATIATDYIPYFGNVNFKDSIYDELNPDKRALRHSDRKNGSTDNILLGNIARSEGLGRQTRPTQQDSGKAPLNDIVLKFRTRFDGNPVVLLDDSGREVDPPIDKKAKDELDDMRKIDFSLPGGIVGRQAFFSIMENIIRNAAKHGNWRSMGNLELTFDVFSSKEEDLKRLEYFNDDNVDEYSLTLKEVISKYYLEATDSKDLYFITITDNCTMVTNRDGKQSWETLGKLRAALMSRYITDSGEMDGTNKGLKEMRISSAWLRAIHDESECFEPYKRDTKVDMLNNDKSDAWKEKNKDKKAPLIYVRISAEKGLLGLDASRLQYIICVQIPRKVALILNDDDSLQTIKTNLERINWRAYSKQEFLKERNKSYEFILIDDLCDGYDNAFNEIRQFATARTFCFSEIAGLDRKDFLNRVINEQYTGKEDLELLYKTLAQYEQKDVIVIDDKVVYERGMKANPSNDFSVGEGKNKIQIFDGFKGVNSVYIYRRHHEANKEFTDFMESEMNALFVEGITGNNSTDRLVRNETLNNVWFYRHLHSMKQQVAIFDERLFHKITGLEEKDLKANKKEKCKDNTALAYLQKGVYPFTFVEDECDEECYKLKGIIFDRNNPVIEVEKIKEDAHSPIKTYYCICDTLATLRIVDGKLVIDPSTNGEYMEKIFDFITIHQGLLDKLYEKFKIKDDIEEKKALTKIIFDKYSKKRELTNGFLPGMIIHSGRSKPNTMEMPQRFPFIQYAALEHAVMDCKFSLVELLDFARYEE